jgi:hypothetical protein
MLETKPRSALGLLEIFIDKDILAPGRYGCPVKR